MRGSPSSAAISSARADGVTLASATLRPSTFETAFCATQTTSPSRRPPAQRSAAASEQAAEVVARAELGQPAQPDDRDVAHSSSAVRASAAALSAIAHQRRHAGDA